MPDTIFSWLGGVGSMAFSVSAIAFVAINVIAVVVVFLTRDPGLVNRFTTPFLVVNLMLLGTGLGVPLAALAARTVISAVTPAFHAKDTDARIQAELEGGTVSR